MEFYFVNRLLQTIISKLIFDPSNQVFKLFKFLFSSLPYISHEVFHPRTSSFRDYCQTYLNRNNCTLLEDVLVFRLSYAILG